MPELAVNIVLHLCIIAIEMIFRDICRYGHMRPERTDIIKLERADLGDVQWFWGPGPPAGE